MKKAGKVLLFSFVFLSLVLGILLTIEFVSATEHGTNKEGCIASCMQWCNSVRSPCGVTWICTNCKAFNWWEKSSGRWECDCTWNSCVKGTAGCGAPASCSGSTPCGSPGSCYAKKTFYKDIDNDLFSDGVAQTVCSQPSGYKLPASLRTTSGDCNDNNAGIGLATIWYRDADGDGYGSRTDTITSCTQPNGYIARDTDNNDSDPRVNPNATEICSGAGRGVDNNQNGFIDEGCFYPALTINSPINGGVYNSSTIGISVDVTANENLNFCSYRIDGGNSFVMVQFGPTHFSHIIPMVAPSRTITEGQHTLIVTCNDTDGWANSSSVNFRIDTLPPAINLISPSSVLYDTRDIRVEITSDGTQQTIWYNWNGLDTVYNSPGTVSFNEGWNTIRAYVNDSAGNRNSVSFSFYVDTINPQITITNPGVDGMSFATNNIPVDYTIADINAVSCWWTNNSGISNHIITCGDNITGQVWDEGQNFVTIYVQDVLQHIGSDTRMFTIDAQAPRITIISPVSNGIYNQDVLLSALITDTNLDLTSTRYEITEAGILITSGVLTLNGTTYDSGFVVDSSWPHRTFTLKVYAKDLTGRTANASVDFIFDDTALSINFINPGANNVSRFNSNFNLNVLVQGYQLAWSDYRIYPLGVGGIVKDNITTFSPGTNSYTWNELVDISTWADGEYGISPTVTDSAIPANNIGATTYFTIDRSGPIVTIDSPVNGTYNYSCIPVTVTHDGVNAWFVWNGTNYTLPLTGCFNFDEGTNIIDVYVDDNTGNIFNRTIIFFVDTISPLVWFVDTTEVSGSTINRNNILANASASDVGTGVASLQINLFNSGGLVNSNSVTNFNNLFSDFTGLADGVYWFVASAVDGAGNGASTETRTVTIDTTAPTINIVSPENKTYTTWNIPFEVNVDSDTASCVYSFDGGATINLMDRITSTDYTQIPAIIADGGYGVTFICADNAGNSANATIVFSVDTTPPGLVIISPEMSRDYDNRLINVNITNPDGTAVLMWYSWGGNDYAYSGPEDVLFPRGVNSLTAHATDEFGNNNSISVIFGVYPSITIINSWIYSAFYPANTNDEVTTTSVTNSIINSSQIANRSVDNIVPILDSYLDNSSLIDVLEINHCTMINSFIFGGNCRDSTLILSNAANSTLNQTTVINSTIIDSIIINTTVISANITNSTVDNSNIINSTIIDSKVVNASIIDGKLYCGNLTFAGFPEYVSDCINETNLTDLINYPPVARLVAPNSADVNSVILFDGSSSTDPNIPSALNDSLTYAFDLGDGRIYVESDVVAPDGTYDGRYSESYNATGIYNLTLTVTDKFGASDSVRRRITIVPAVPGATCSDGIQNQGEAGVDCGGPCSASCGGGNTGGSSGGGTTNTGLPFSYQAGPGNHIYWPTGEELAKCYTVSLRLREVIKFFVEYQLYYFETTNVTSNKVFAEVRWPVVPAEFSPGVEKKFDVNNDGHEDISVKLDKIESIGRDLFGTVTMCRLFKEGQTVESDVPEGTVFEPAQVPLRGLWQVIKDNWLLSLAIILTLFAIIAATYYYVVVMGKKNPTKTDKIKSNKLEVNPEVKKAKK